MIWTLGVTGAIIYLPIVIFSLTIHELAHGYAALWCGDPTAKNQGRLTFNPLAHLDLFGTLAMLLAYIGWAKPVPINPQNFKNRKWGVAIVSVAGPLSNFLIAILALLIYTQISRPFGLDNSMLGLFLIMMAGSNLGLAIFNLLPIPPLDGSKIFLSLAPRSVQEAIWKYEQYGILILLFVIYYLSDYIGLAIDSILNIFLRS